MSGADFAFFLFLRQRERPTPWRLLLWCLRHLSTSHELTTADRKPTSRAVSGISFRVFGPLRSALYQILRSTAFPITRKNDYLPSPAAVKYHSHLTTCPPRHPDEFIEKCGVGHNVLARQCIL
ncbi:hypothetical protein AVEN_140779-1 [Araneus ventricosus]|uniref:Uncharacterized protein n=1 Tax=Araneus ventricosus TaxID=182803 RepID=A0A4Y2V9X8_ARAVE|nr:hypothetical protein AVEN_140779-1 [Araneus ventricosus]